MTGGTRIVDKDNNLIEFIPDPECMECGDAVSWIDEATELCESCYEFIFGEEPDYGF